MNDQDYIRKAVELADGTWFVQDSGEIQTPYMQVLPIDELMQWDLDALAAQLVRQVDATEQYYVVVRDDQTEIRSCGAINKLEQGGDRTMNTIKAVIDSGVLKD